MGTKNKRMGRPPVDSELLRFRSEREIIDGIDTFASDSEMNRDAPISRPEALRRITRDWLIGHGYIPHEPEEGTRPEDLDASNDD